MRASQLSAPILLAASAVAAPLEARQSNIDTTVLQFALTLEHLENVFYKGALQNFTEQDFEEAGYSATYFTNLKYIASDEQDHVMFLSQALTAAGVTPNKACTYNFPYKDVYVFSHLQLGEASLIQATARASSPSHLCSRALAPVPTSAVLL